MYNFQQAVHGPSIEAAREKAAYDKLLAKYEALQFAADEGVFQVTIHSDSGPITVPVSFLEGRNIAALLAESFAEWVQQMETTLNWSIEAAGDEFKIEKERKVAAEEALEARQKAGRAAIAASYEVPVLAQQAAATAAPVQRKPGRPKRQPQPEVAQQLAVAANAVPMNGANKLPGGGVANQPQG